MIGHGRPSSLALALARIALLLCAFQTCAAFGQEIAQPAEPMRLRVTWGGGQASQWTGRVRLDKGELSSLKLLGLDADAAGSVWLDKSQVHIGSLSPRKSDRFEIAANAAADANLLIELAAGAPATPAQAKIPLADLLKRPYQLPLDDRGNSLKIEVIPNPALHISIKRESLIFAPGEQLSFELAPELANTLHGTTLDIHATLTAARHKEVSWFENQRLPVPVNGHPKMDLNVPLQVPEGVYTVHVSVSRPAGYIRDKFLPGAATPIAERSFQIVVLDPHPPTQTPNADWDAVLEIDPTNPRWVERLPSWTQFRRIPGLNGGPLGSIRTASVELTLGRFVELPAPAAGADPHWQAYSLPLEVVGVPHVLEIDFPSDEEQHFGLSIVEPNAVGVVEGIHRDAGVYVEGLGRSEAKQKQTQRLIFWPRTQAPLLVVTNQHPTAAAHFGQIRVLKRTGQMSADAKGPPSRERLIAAYLARPLAAETFGATQSAENTSIGGASESVDDCQTFYETATRLADYVRYGGFNSAVVSVMADGSSIYPNPQMLFTPRYDTGRLADRLRDTDGLELTLRVFDREQLTLVPAIEFAAPLPKLEELRRASDSQTSGLELIGPDGRTWLETNGARSGLAPYYNLLDPRVQRAMLDIVGDLVKRYGGHPAFGGLAIQLSGDGYSQLPPIEWALDDATVERFERASGIQLNATGSGRFAARHAALTGQHANAWRSWRAAQVADFYGRLAALVRGDSDRRLLLTTEKLFDHPQIGRRIRPNLLVENRVPSMLLELGLDRQSLERVPGLVLCPTRYVEPMTPLPERAADLELNEAFAQWRQPGSIAKPGALLYHRPVQLRLESFENGSPFRVVDEMRLTSQPLPQGAAARQPYLQALLEGDPAVLIDGGDLLPLGQEELLRGVRSVLAELPASAKVSEVTKQPVVVRTYAEANQATIVVLNMSPFHVEAQVTLDVPQSATLEPLSAPTDENMSAPVKSLTVAAGRQPWKLSLEPFEIRAVRIPISGAKAVEVRADLGAAASAELTARLADLANRDLSAERAYRGPANPSFESIGGAGPIAGWHISSNAGNPTMQLDATSPQDEKTSLYFRSGGQAATVDSDPFPTPTTGQLAMTVFARGQNIAPNTELRLVFKSERGGQVYLRAASVRGTETQRENQQWGRPFAILVNDLPLESHGQMQISFELTGPGEVWLDNVKLYDLLFPLKFYGNKDAEILQLLRRTHDAQAAFDAGQVSNCIQLLDGYWPKFVTAYTPLAQPKIALAPAPQTKQQPSTPQSNEGEQPAPGIRDHIKRIVPILR